MHLSFFSFSLGGGCSQAMALVNFQCRGFLLTLIIVGQGPTVLTVCAGQVVWTFFSYLSFLFSHSLSDRRPDRD